MSELLDLWAKLESRSRIHILTLKDAAGKILEHLVFIFFSLSNCFFVKLLLFFVFKHLLAALASSSFHSYTIDFVSSPFSPYFHVTLHQMILGQDRVEMKNRITNRGRCWQRG